ncbi:MAG: 2-amino-4-oxopentanoate thiolase subunit OrtA [Ilumatobacteraceae bacterium]
MDDAVASGTWVELHRVVLTAGARASQVPAETQAVPLEQRVRGWLVEPARLGDEAEVRTAAGRRLAGTLVIVEPGHTHTFGPSVPETSAIGDELRELLREEAPR